MKGTLLAVLALFVISCNEQEPLEGKETRILLEAFELESGETLLSGLTSLRVIVLQDAVVARYFYFPATSSPGNGVTVNLPVGKYELLFIANGPGEKEVTCNIGDPLEKITLNLLKEGDAYREAPDFLTASKQVNVTMNKDAAITVPLARRVGKIRVTLTNLPPGIDSLAIELANAPASIPAGGKATGTGARVVKRVDYTRGSPSATAEIMTFPVAAGKAEIGVLYSIGPVTYRGFMKLSPAIEDNRVVAVAGKYLPTSPLGFAFSLQSWDEANVINGGSLELGDLDEVAADNTPAAGVPTGGNLLANAGFETWSADTLPAGWKYNRDGVNATARASVARVAEGKRACLLEPRSYIYQDVAVTERRCYRLRARVNSNTDAYKWRVFCTWRKTASSALPAAASAAIQTAEAGATDGWIDVFGNENKFRAPVGAKILRVEVRAYTAGDHALLANEGLCIDDLDVRLLAE
ncbi:MAG: FimB/Mfa2 family fimbrial subunit [Odoribacteraceae bacterium]|jgi:hypothetical protein|nr:FimB/Mfa2 family fimbrial subunit [Odoribacteraceae bacterium]